MQNYIGLLNPNEIVIALYHPKLLHLYHKFKRSLDFVIKRFQDEGTKKLYEHLADLEVGVSLEGFVLKCESLGFSKDLIECDKNTFAKYCELEGDDFKSLIYKIKNYLVNEEIKYCVEQYNIDHEPDKFIDKIADLKVSDLNSNFNDPKMFSTCRFTDIDPTNVTAEFEQGVLKSTLGLINESVAVGGYVPGSATVFCGPTKSGKSLIAMQETINFLKQGANVIYSAFGDLNKNHFLARMAAMINNRPISYTMKHPVEEMRQAVKTVPELENLELQFLAPDKYTSGDYVDFLKNAYEKNGVQKLHDWADVIIVDYDANIKTKFEDNMYKKGEDIYQNLYSLVYPDKILVILAQTSKIAWEKEIVELGDLGESSRKQQIVDI